MTTQEAYEGIRAFFNKKGARLAKSPDGGCFYRVGKRPDAKLRCAIGCLISDDKYEAGFDGAPLQSVLRKSGLQDVDPVFAGRIQSAHDSSESVAEFRKAIDRVARQHGLTVPA